MESADAVYPPGASALARGRRLRRPAPRARRRTTPVTFAEIKEVDEENAELGASAAAQEGGERRRRPDVLDERLGAAAARRRQAALRELSPAARAGPEPAALPRAADT